ncbi:MAG: reverse transcriptase family protein, partial [Candidatus Thiodiazotropha sp.]
MDELYENNSDHYPLRCYLRETVSKSQTKSQNLMKSQKVRWDKLDKDLYKASVSQGLQRLEISNNSMGGLDNTVMKFNEVLVNSAKLAAPAKVQRMRKPKLEVWTPEISSALASKKSAFHDWKVAGCPQDSSDPSLVAKKESTKMFRKACRIEVAKQRFEDRQEILNARSDNMALFHKLVNKQRGRLSSYIDELHVDGNTYKSEAGVLSGWFEHFRKLASCDEELFQCQSYHKLVQQEFPEIEDICKWYGQDVIPITREELMKSLSKLNRGKAADIMGLTAEHLLFSEDSALDTLLVILNEILQKGSITDSMKIGLLTPVYKKKGSKMDSKNYRGITVIPIITKILELILRERITPTILAHQNGLQRGFTEHSSPLNAALILEEFIRDRRDTKTPVYIAFLDAKSAFDVVSHSSLKRKLFHIGIEGNSWSLINSLHRDAQSAVKWQGQISDKFHVGQGVRQGGILSTDLYKVYNNRLLDRLMCTGMGARIGNVCCVAPTCADDVALASDDKVTLQSLVDIAVDYSKMELYKLQPVKSVVLEMLNGSRKKVNKSAGDLVMDGEPMPVVEKTTHVGINRSNDSDETTVSENVIKARRTLYSLMSAGLHGENGLDPQTSLHLYQIYVVPVLLYGLEVVLPRPKYLSVIEQFNKKYLKCLLSVPVTVADA